MYEVAAECSRCGELFDFNKPLTICTKCGGALLTRYDLAELARNLRARWKRNYVSAKYLWKFAFDKLIELEIPEGVADFIEGRVPQRIDTKHARASVDQQCQKP